MSPRSVIADEVNPEVLRWARETAGLDVEQVVRRLPKAERWERGDERPTMRQLEALSDLYKRPLAIFFLPAPPQEPPLPSDYRVLPTEEPRTISRKVRLAIRTARRAQRLYAELARELGVAGPFRPRDVAVTDDPETGSDRIRNLLQVPLEQQYEWTDTYAAFRAWRSTAEALGVFVLQVPMPVREARGFSFSEGPTPTIVVNSSDAIAARIFTLFHELAHLWLNQDGLCLPDPAATAEPDVQLESFCNHFSGALLVPRVALAARPELRQLPDARPEEIDARIDMAVRLFKVSRYVILRRLLTMDYISLQGFRRTVDRWLAAEIQPRGGGPQSPAEKALSHFGTRFVSLVLEAHGRGVITSSDVSDYLSLKLRHVPHLERLLVAQARG